MQFRKMFAIIETCYSGLVAQDCAGIPGLLMMTAANPYETSKAAVFDNELRDGVQPGKLRQLVSQQHGGIHPPFLRNNNLNFNTARPTGKFLCFRMYF